MASSPITSWQIDGETMEIVADFIFLGSKITADGDHSHEIKRCLLFGRKPMTNLDSILKGRDITLPTKVHLVKAMVFPVVMCGCELDHKESWKKESAVAQSWLTLCNPMDYSLPAFSIHGIFQERVLEWVAISFSRGSSWPRDQTWVSRISGRCFNVWATREAEHLRIDAFELWCWRRLLRVAWIARRSNQSILKEIIPEYLLDGLMLKLKLQYFGHLMQRIDSLQKTLILGKNEVRRRRGWQRMRWLDGITDLMDMSFSRLWELVMGWHPAVHRVIKSRTRLSDWTELEISTCTL